MPYVPKLLCTRWLLFHVRFILNGFLVFINRKTCLLLRRLIIKVNLKQFNILHVLIYNICVTTDIAKQKSLIHDYVICLCDSFPKSHGKGARVGGHG